MAYVYEVDFVEKYYHDPNDTGYIVVPHTVIVDAKSEDEAKSRTKAWFGEKCDMVTRVTKMQFI